MRRTLLSAGLALALLTACGSDGDDTACRGAACDEGAGGTGATGLHALVLLPAACVEDADCCVVYETCRAEAFVVLASDYDEARELAANAPRDACVRCLAPSVEVRCVDGACAGFELAMDDPAWEASHVDHCGSPAAGDAAGADAAGAGEVGARLLNCGS